MPKRGRKRPPGRGFFVRMLRRKYSSLEPKKAVKRTVKVPYQKSEQRLKELDLTPSGQRGVYTIPTDLGIARIKISPKAKARFTELEVVDIKIKEKAGKVTYEADELAKAVFDIVLQKIIK